MDSETQKKEMMQMFDLCMKEYEFLHQEIYNLQEEVYDLQRKLNGANRLLREHNYPNPGCLAQIYCLYRNNADLTEFQLRKMEVCPDNYQLIKRYVIKIEYGSHTSLLINLTKEMLRRDKEKYLENIENFKATEEYRKSNNKTKLREEFLSRIKLIHFHATGFKLVNLQEPELLEIIDKVIADNYLIY